MFSICSCNPSGVSEEGGGGVTDGERRICCMNEYEVAARVMLARGSVGGGSGLF